MPATSCSTSATLAPGTYPVTATYSGDTNYIRHDRDRSELHGHQGGHVDDRVRVAGIDRLRLAGHAVDQRIARRCNGNRDLHVRWSHALHATLPATSCQTATTLAPGTYPVTATYPGDSNYKGTTATGASFTVTKANPGFTESAAPSSVPYGTADTLS